MEGKTEFDRLMRDAVAIKSAQLAQYRKKFDLWPQFHQAGLYYCESFKHLHNGPLREIVPFYEEKKKEALKLFQSQEFQQALHKYEEILTIFRWVENRNEKWRNSGIEDDDLTVCHAEKNELVNEMVIAIYLNIALCNLKLQVWKEAVAACDEVLAIDPQNVKGLYRKALALTTPVGSDLDNYRDAIKLLAKALHNEPGNFEVREKLNEFKAFLADQKEKSKKTFGSFFKKHAYEDVEPAKVNNAAREYEELIEKGENMVKDLRAKGKKTEARSLQKNVKLMKKHKEKAIEEAKKKALDFENPSEEMKKSALEFGIDLNDPVVQAELKKLKQGKELENLESLENSEEEENQSERKVSSYKWIFLAIFIAFLAFFFYNPSPAEMW
jgi:hypothetical protein